MAKVAATGFVAQENIMKYATPEVSHYTHNGYSTWSMAREAGKLFWEPNREGLILAHTGKVVPDHVAVTRGVAGPYIGTVSNRMSLIDHDLLGDVVTTVCQANPGSMISALITLNGGRRVGARVTHGTVQFDFDSSLIAKETWVWLRHDARGSLQIVENAQRLACTNQLGFIGKHTNTEFRVRHTGNVSNKIRLLIDRYNEGTDWAKWEKQMTEMQQTTVTGGAWMRFMNEWLPTDDEKTSTRMENARTNLYGLWEEYREDLGNTMYAGYQAITEFEDQFRSSKGASGVFDRAVQENPRKRLALQTLIAAR
jgi:hypothetical protein